MFRLLVSVLSELGTKQPRSHKPQFNLLMISSGQYVGARRLWRPRVAGWLMASKIWHHAGGQLYSSAASVRSAVSPNDFLRVCRGSRPPLRRARQLRAATTVDNPPPCVQTTDSLHWETWLRIIYEVGLEYFWRWKRLVSNNEPQYSLISTRWT